MALALFMNFPATAASSWDNADTDKVCAAATAVEVPSIDRSGSENMADCNSGDAYYGIGRPVNMGEARRCAYRERERSTGPVGGLVGSAILTMIYANGDGVGRNYDLAIKFACESAWAPKEREGRVRHLIQLRDTNRCATADGSRLSDYCAPKFDFCQDVTSSMMTEVCEYNDTLIAGEAHNNVLRTALANATSDQKIAFDKLQRAAETYFELHGVDSTQINGAGTLHATMAMARSENQRTEFIENFVRLEKKDWPEATKEDFVAADRTLNAAFKKLLEWDGLTDGIDSHESRKAELAWISYRDRWLDFARQRYPDLSQEALRTLLTRQRTEAIEGIIR
jgi:uncharacterized protein YecT (DUF1311 family)